MNITITTAGVLALLLPAAALAGTVTPSSVDEEVAPGDSTTVSKSVTLDAVTPKIDVLLLVDLSGSYYDDIDNLQTQGDGTDGLAAELFDGVCTTDVDCQFGLASFVDFPFAQWGYDYSSWDDYAYRLDLDFTTDRTAFVTAVDAMVTENGGDAPESQYEALYQAVTGAGRDIDGDGAYDKLGEIAPGNNATFRSDATRVIVITTDNYMHETGDACNGSTSTLWTSCDDSYPDLGTAGYPGAGSDDTITALVGAGVKVIGLKAGTTNTYGVAQLTELATATGGSYQTTDDDSADIVTAVIAGVEALTFTVTASPDATCDPLSFTYTPASHTDVAGGETVTFTEEIGVPLTITPGDLNDDSEIVCWVDFLADDTVIGTQDVIVYVPLNSPPVAVCQDLTLSADASCEGTGDVDDGSYDPDGDTITLSYSDAGPYPVGTTEVTLTVTDSYGEVDTCTATVTVVDDTPPTITVGDQVELWPPNHKYVELGLADCDVSAEDACAGTVDIETLAVITSIYSDEEEEATGKGDGKTWDDMVIIDDVEFDLRAERDGNGNGRVYGVTFEVDDGAGNVTEATCTFGVPHSQNGDAPVDDGAAYGYSIP